MKLNERYVINTDNWFFAPDGEQYRAVFGTVHAVLDSQEALGVRTNAKSTNWYVVIGDMIVAGCQIHYAVRADDYSPLPPTFEIDHEGKRFTGQSGTSRIYDADRSGKIGFGA